MKDEKGIRGESNAATALRSVCLPGRGRVSQVYVPGDNFSDPVLLVAAARYFAVDLVALRQRCKELLTGATTCLAHQHSPALVSLTLGTLGEKTGFINLLALDKVQAQGKHCTILLKDGVALPRWLSGDSKAAHGARLSFGSCRRQGFVGYMDPGRRGR